MTAFYSVNLATSAVASALRFGAGGVRLEAASLAEPLLLYEFEACPYCRVAREAIAQAGVPVIVRPCPKGGKRFRPDVERLGGKAQFPYLVDPNTGAAMYESANISKYLHETYGGGRHWLHWLAPLNLFSSQLAMLVRFLRGMFYLKQSYHLANPVELYAGERDPRARLVKEVMCESEVEYLWRPSRGAPRIVDPNIGVEVIGASAILRHIRRVYRP
ncbi:MAG: hypothetical protein HKN14_02560 [Marinicaulis sp.]|nr:glutathione S-transferase N-terminal domain-containing protein [Marinicaulis sp.]NNE39782.1 hypothetical protein [Marinicaulis sp.]NNL88811.1 hypothetical protein [Marinicaulis sp.]